MALGERLWEEQGKLTMFYISEIKMEGILVKQSFMSEVKGLGKFPSGKNMGSGEVWMSPDGKMKAWFRGMLMTSDGEMLVWKASSNATGGANNYKAVQTVNFMTRSEKYSWLNSALVVSEIQGDMESFTNIGYEWK